MLKGKITRANNKDAIKQHIDKLIQGKQLLSKQKRDTSVEEIVGEILLKMEKNEIQVNFNEATIWVTLGGDRGLHYFHIAARLLENKLELIKWELSSRFARFLLRPLTNQVQIDIALEAINKQAHHYDMHIYKKSESEGYYAEIYKEEI